MRDPKDNHRSPPAPRRISIAAATGAFALAGAACTDKHTVPEQPTWADVEPILRGTCTQCHGSNAAAAGASYRFDFYDMAPDVCGAASSALEGQGLAHGLVQLIASDVTPPGSGWRPRMPPAPTEPLVDWQRETILRWAKTPLRGAPPPGNRKPYIQLQAASGTADKSLAFTALLSDDDGESVVGVLNFGDRTFLMDRPGSFSAKIDTSKWTPGVHPINATLCDGWGNITYDLGGVLIEHAPATLDAGGSPADASSPDASTPSDGLTADVVDGGVADGTKSD